MHAAPVLFPHAGWRPAAFAHPADVATPLGVFVTVAHVDGHVLEPSAATTFDDGGAARLWVWEGGVFRAELLRLRVPPSDAGAAACEIVRWRLHATERPAECQVSCRWQGSAPAAVEQPDGDAAGVFRRWRARGWCVQVGAPARGASVHGLPDGIVTSAPMERGARVESRVVIAWWSERGGEAPRWPDADAPFERLLARSDAPSAR
jgi:hypothetical protein